VTKPKAKVKMKATRPSGIHQLRNRIESLDIAVVSLNNEMVGRFRLLNESLDGHSAHSLAYARESRQNVNKLLDYLPIFGKALDDIAKQRHESTTTFIGWFRDIHKMCGAHNVEMERMVSIQKLILKRLDRLEKQAPVIHLEGNAHLVATAVKPAFKSPKCVVEDCTGIAWDTKGYCLGHIQKRGDSQSGTVGAKTPGAKLYPELSHKLCANLDCINLALLNSVYCATHAKPIVGSGG
jgi:hypothetical protein